MCQHPAYQVNVSRKVFFCVLDSSNFFGTPCALLFTKRYPGKNAVTISAVKNMPIKQEFSLSLTMFR